MRTDTPPTIFLKDYIPPTFLVDSIDLRFELGDEHTDVTARLQVRRNPTGRRHRSLRLDGQELELRALRLDGESLSEGDYAADGESLTIARVPDAFVLEIDTRIRPQDNTALEGLYKSGGMFCTQCEAEGFRRITYYLDRPDVMARFSTMIIADRSRYPVLLSNGNRVDGGVLPGGRHWAKWDDPFRKPSYLFALVAGDLAAMEDRFLTSGGRDVRLVIYSEPESIERCEFAMQCLKKAMRWDEERFGFEYDLDIYMIVAVGDFNMGAMENKGLNIFNTSCVLADPRTATDSDFERVLGVIGHEYFHNWTGNRITCRDWFQLSLKEGLTVFRDEEFSADMTSPAVKRIDDVRILRSVQFAEDSGPMAHPVRPDSYIEVSNFYTTTVYNKGAEVVRMLQTLLGREGFRQGMSLYVERHDGQAVTTDDFVRAMADANGRELRQFRRWYEQAGTPVLTVRGEYDANARTYTLRVRQHCPATPGQKGKKPFHMPLAIGLLDRNGRDLAVRLDGEPAEPAPGTRVFELRNERETLQFVGIPGRPVPSVLRGFSAPVRVEIDLGDEDLAFLAANDSDAFNRWDAFQQLGVRVLLGLIDTLRSGGAPELDQRLVDVCGLLLADEDADPALVAEMLVLPDEGYLSDLMDVADPDAVHSARNFARASLAEAHHLRFAERYESSAFGGAYRFLPRDAARRRLRNVCLGYLVETGDRGMIERCLAQFRGADNMTDELGALAVLANTDCAQRAKALDAFYRRWRANPLVVDKWFALQARCRLPGTVETVRGLLGHEAFDLRNPNKVRALIGAFAHANPVRFHDRSGAGYDFVADQIVRLDAVNAQVAARLTGAFARWRKYGPERQAMMRGHLERIARREGVSRDTYEVATKSLGNGDD
jgi:aminopeptidase N